MRNSTVEQKSALSSLSALAVLIVTLCVLAMQQMGPSPTEMGVNPYLVEWAQAGQNANYISQRQAHTAAVVTCALLILTLTRFAGARWLTFKQPYLRIINTLGLVTLAGFCLSSIYFWISQPVSKFALLITDLAILALALFGRRLPPIFISIPLAAALLAVLPGLMVVYDSSWMTPSAFVEFQQGYSVVASQCDRISMGHQIFQTVKPNYGLFLQVLCGLWERANGIFTFGQNIQIIKWLQAISVFFSFTAYAWYARKRPFPLTLALLLMLPWLHTNQLSLLFPNLSPWRSFGFPLASIALIVATKLPARVRFWFLGIIAGLCLSLNLETGVAIFVGYLAFIYFSCHAPGKIFPLSFIKGTFQCLTGIAGYYLAFYTFIYFGLGYFPDLSAYAKHLQVLSYMTKTGYCGGFRLAYSPLPVFIFCHYSYILLRSALSKRPLTSRECFRTFAATTALVWSVYYFNRPNEWYFQPQYFFYSFLLIDISRLAQSKAWTERTLENRIISIACLLVVITPQIVLSCESAWPSYHKMIRQWRYGRLSDKNAVILSDIYVQPKIAEELTQKAKFLIEENSRERVIYLTGSTVLIPKLTKLYLKTDFDDPFQELTYTKDINKFVSKIKQSAVKKVLVDSKDCYLAGDKFRAQCWQNIETKLQPEFQFAQEKDGWRILVRTGAIPKEPNDIGLDEAKK